MNLLNLVGLRLDNIYQIRRKWYYSSGWKNFQTKQGLDKINKLRYCPVILHVWHGDDLWLDLWVRAADLQADANA